MSAKPPDSHAATAGQAGLTSRSRRLGTLWLSILHFSNGDGVVIRREREVDEDSSPWADTVTSVTCCVGKVALLPVQLVPLGWAVLGDDRQRFYVATIFRHRVMVEILSGKRIPSGVVLNAAPATIARSLSRQSET
jgi:hypothetical protein